MSSQMDEIPTLRVDVFSLIRSFFGTLTASQWLNLITGKPDQTTKARLLDLIVKIINHLSTALQTFIWSTDTDVTKELVDSSLSNRVIDSFQDALNVKAQSHGPSAEALRDMISEEVIYSVLCSMSDNPKEHVPAPSRMKKMLRHASKMIKAIKKKVRAPCTRGNRKKGLDLNSVEPTTSGQEQYWYDPASPLPIAEKTQYQCDSASPLPTAEKTQYSCDSASPLTIVEKTRNWYDPASPLPTAEKTRYSRDSASPLTIAKKTRYSCYSPSPLTIAEKTRYSCYSASPLTIVEKTRNWYDPASPLPTAEKTRYSCDSASPLTIAEKTRYSCDSASPLTSVEKTRNWYDEASPLPTAEKTRYRCDSPSSDNKGCSVSGVIHVKPYNAKKTVPEPEMAETKTREKTPEVEENLLVKKLYWNDTASSEEAVPLPAPADLSQEEKRKNAVLMVVEKLVLLIYSRCKVSTDTAETASVIERLMEMTWAAVEGIDFDPSPETVADLEKAIFKGLVKKWGGAEMVMLRMRMSSVVLERFVINAVKDRLALPPKEKKKRKCVCRFFSSMGRAIAGFCKGSKAVD